jgi:hypothetical protein
MIDYTKMTVDELSDILYAEYCEAVDGTDTNSVFRHGYARQELARRAREADDLRAALAKSEALAVIDKDRWREVEPYLPRATEIMDWAQIIKYFAEEEKTAASERDEALAALAKSEAEVARLRGIIDEAGADAKELREAIEIISGQRDHWMAQARALMPANVVERLRVAEAEVAVLRSKMAEARDIIAELEAQVAEARELFLDRIVLLNTPWKNHDANDYRLWRERQSKWLARTEPKVKP